MLTTHAMKGLGFGLTISFLLVSLPVSFAAERVYQYGGRKVVIADGVSAAGHAFLRIEYDLGELEFRRNEPIHRRFARGGIGSAEARKETWSNPMTPKEISQTWSSCDLPAHENTVTFSVGHPAQWSKFERLPDGVRWLAEPQMNQMLRAHRSQLELMIQNFNPRQIPASDRDCYAARGDSADWDIRALKELITYATETRKPGDKDYGLDSVKDEFRKAVKLGKVGSELSASAAQASLANEVARKHALFITHSDKLWDRHQKVLPAIQSLLERFRSIQLPVYQLVGDDRGLGDFPYYLAFAGMRVQRSGGGEHDVSVETSEITSVGNYFMMCQGFTWVHAADTYFDRTGGRRFVVNLPAQAILIQPLDDLDPSSPANQHLVSVADYIRQHGARKFYEYTRDQEWLRWLGQNSKYFKSAQLRMTLDGKELGTFSSPTPETKTHEVELRVWLDHTVSVTR
jgi:hypothetical protein